MTQVSITAEDMPDINELVDLYDSVGWTSYTQNPTLLINGVRNSLRIVTARAKDGTLLGLARMVGDGYTIAYLQDILVRPEWQRKGIGSLLLDEAFRPYRSVRQQVLLTDDTVKQRDFYESAGFKDITTEGFLRAFIRQGVSTEHTQQ